MAPSDYAIFDAHDYSIWHLDFKSLITFPVTLHLFPQIEVDKGSFEQVAFENLLLHHAYGRGQCESMCSIFILVA